MLVEQLAAALQPAKHQHELLALLVACKDVSLADKRLQRLAENIRDRNQLLNGIARALVEHLAEQDAGEMRAWMTALDKQARHRAKSAAAAGQAGAAASEEEAAFQVAAEAAAAQGAARRAAAEAYAAEWAAGLPFLPVNTPDLDTASKLQIIEWVLTAQGWPEGWLQQLR